MRQKVKFNNEKSFLDQTKIILTRPKRPVDNQMTANEGQMTANEGQMTARWRPDDSRCQQMAEDYYQKKVRWRQMTARRRSDESQMIANEGQITAIEGHMIADKGQMTAINGN